MKLVAALMIAVALLAGLVACNRSVAVQQAPGLRELHAVNELQSVFNRDKGNDRLILLLSPT